MRGPLILFVLGMVLFVPVGWAARDCYDLGDNLGKWEALSLQSAQSQVMYRKTLMGKTQKEMEKVLERWVKSGARPNSIDITGALRQAVDSCYLKSLNLLLDHGVRANTPLRDETPLRASVSTILCEEKQTQPLVEALLKKGASVNERDGAGETALMLAALSGRAGVIGQLVKAGAALEATDCAKRTALHWAAAGGEPTAVDALLKAGANPRAKDAHGMTPRQLAAQYSQRTLPTMARYEDYNRAFLLITQAEAINGNQAKP